MGGVDGRCAWGALAEGAKLTRIGDNIVRVEVVLSEIRVSSEELRAAPAVDGGAGGGDERGRESQSRRERGSD